MLYSYTSIVVLLGGAYCFPLRNTTDKSPCTVVIKRFDEPVTTLEVEWHSTIHLICDASCVGPGPQPALTWSYEDKKNQFNSKFIKIERQFRSPKFDTYPSTFHRKNELRIRDFGPDEETTFICRGSINKEKLNATVKLIGTDCLLKYNFRCKSDKRCIDRGQLCNDNNDCPDGEDEDGCDNTTTVTTTRMPETDVVIKQTLEDSYYIDMTTTVSTTRMPETDVETKQTSEESSYIDITMTASTMRMPETDMETKQTSEERKPCEFRCRNGTCIASTKKCDGIPDCPDGDDEICDFGPACSEGKKACKDRSNCIDDSQRCNRVQDCTDGGDEEDCGPDFGSACPEGKKACKDRSNCIDDSQRCNGVQDCTDGGDEEDCGPEKEIMMTLMSGTGINIAGDTDPVSTTDGVTATTGKFTETTSFNYEDYIY